MIPEPSASVVLEKDSTYIPEVWVRTLGAAQTKGKGGHSGEKWTERKTDSSSWVNRHGSPLGSSSLLSAGSSGCGPSAIGASGQTTTSRCRWVCCCLSPRALQTRRADDRDVID